MTARIVSLDRIRAKVDQRRDSREETELSELERSQRRWKNDLKGWPRAFREAVLPLLNRMGDPDVLPTGEHRWVFAQGSTECTENLTERRQAGLPPEEQLSLVRDFARRPSEGTQRKLLRTLWVGGTRRLERRALETAARAYVQAEQAACIEFKLRRQKQAAKGRAKIASGEAKNHTHTRIETAESDVLDAEWRLEHVFQWAQANPVRFALGCTPKWIRAGRPRMQTVDRSELRSTLSGLDRMREKLTEQARQEAAESETNRVLAWANQALRDVHRKIQAVLDSGAGLERAGGLS